MIFRLIRKLLPSFLCLAAVAFIATGASTICNPPPTEPAVVSIRDLERTWDSSARWLKIPDGVLYWPATVSVQYKKSGRSSGHYVPLVSSERAANWPDAGGAGRACIVVHFSEEELRTAFPSVADKSRVPLTSAYAASFEPKDIKAAFVEKGGDVAARFLEAGFDTVIVAEPGSKPLQASEAPFMIATGLGFGIGGILWIRRRKKVPAAPAPPAFDMEAAMLRGIQSGVREAVDRAVRKGVSAGSERTMQP
jgi:hypothetical protein